MNYINSSLFKRNSIFAQHKNKIIIIKLNYSNITCKVLKALSCII